MKSIKYFEVILTVLTFVWGFPDADAAVTLTIPSTKNCAEDLILTCGLTGTFLPGDSRTWRFKDTPVISHGVSTNSNKYEESLANTGSQSFSMTVKAVSTADVGMYRCDYGFDNSQDTALSYKCYSTSLTDIDISRNDDKKVVMILNSIAPNVPTTVIQVRIDDLIKTGDAIGSDPDNDGLYTVTWTSTDAVSDAKHTFVPSVNVGDGLTTLATIDKEFAAKPDDGPPIGPIVCGIVGGVVVICIIIAIIVLHKKKLLCFAEEQKVEVKKPMNGPGNENKDFTAL